MTSMERNEGLVTRIENKDFPDALHPSEVTILGYGALLSETSSRLTFPALSNFRYVRVKGMRRVFAHPHLFLLREGITDPEQTLKLASLSVEPTNDDNVSFIATAFEVSLDDEQRQKFVNREKGYRIVTTTYESITTNNDDHSNPTCEKSGGEGIICIASDDSKLDFEVPASIKNKGGVWHWSKTSGLLPANIYLRHCILSLKPIGGPPYDSFLHETYLADRETTLAEYLEENCDEVMSSHPPTHLTNRFGG